MKIKIFLIVLITFAFIYKAEAQVTVVLQPSSPISFNMGDFWKGTLVNTAQGTISVYLHATATETSSGLIIDANSSKFNLPPGVKILNTKDIAPVKYNQINSKYKDVINNLGTLPGGNYEICVSVISADSGTTVLGSQCMERLVQNITQTQIIYPLDEMTVTEQVPVFTWLPPMPLNKNQAVTYTLKITEIFSKQSAIDAMRSNPAFFEKSSIQATVLQYPAASRNLEEGKKYSLQVLTYIDGVLASQSEVRQFLYKGKISETKTDEKKDIKKMGYIYPGSFEPGNTAFKLKDYGQAYLKNTDGIPGGLSMFKKIPPFSFYGDLRVDGETSNRQGTYSSMNSRYVNFEFNPGISVYGIPFTSNFLLSSLNGGAFQSINSFAVNLDLDKLKEVIDKQKVENNGKLTPLQKIFSPVTTLGIGVTYPNYTPLTVQGPAVTGANIELNPGIMYFALSALKNQKGIDNISYSRNLYSGRIGLGKKEGKHIHMTLLYVRDNENSITNTDPYLTPNANYLFGMEGKYLFLKDKLSLEGEAVFSLFTKDVRDPDVANPTLPGWLNSIAPQKLSSSIDNAYTVKSVFNNVKSFTKITLSVRRYGSGFKSLGAPGHPYDKFGFEGKIEQKFLQSQISLTASFKRDKDNLSNWNPYTTVTTSPVVNLGLFFKKVPYLILIYSPYFQKNDASNPFWQVDNRLQMFTGITGYTFYSKGITSTSTLTYMLQDNKTLSPYSDFTIHNMNLRESVNFTFPLTLETGLNVIHNRTGGVYGRTIVFNFDGSYQQLESLSHKAGIELAFEKGISKKFMVYLNSTLTLWNTLILDLKASNSVFNDWVLSTNDYKEFIFTSTLSYRW